MDYTNKEKQLLDKYSNLTYPLQDFVEEYTSRTPKTRQYLMKYVMNNHPDTYEVVKHLNLH